MTHAWAPQDKTRHRPHPDFPDDKSMTQYRVWDSSSNSHEDILKRTRSMHWTALVNGDTALEMAKNLEDMFALPSAPTARAVPEQTEKPAQVKALNPSLYAQQWVNKSSEWAKVFRECSAKLGDKATFIPLAHHPSSLLLHPHPCSLLLLLLPGSPRSYEALGEGVKGAEGTIGPTWASRRALKPFGDARTRACWAPSGRLEILAGLPSNRSLAP